MDNQPQKHNCPTKFDKTVIDVIHEDSKAPNRIVTRIAIGGNESILGALFPYKVPYKYFKAKAALNHIHDKHDQEGKQIRF